MARRAVTAEELWLSVFSGVVATMLGVVHAFGELRPALVRRGNELHENGGALDGVRPALLKRWKNLSYAAASLGRWEILLRRRYCRTRRAAASRGVVRRHRMIKEKEHPLPSTFGRGKNLRKRELRSAYVVVAYDSRGASNRWWDSRCGCGNSARRCECVRCSIHRHSLICGTPSVVTASASDLPNASGPARTDRPTHGVGLTG